MSVYPAAVPTENVKAGNAVAPQITDVTYRNYDGPLKNHAVRWWVIAAATIRAAVNKSRFGYWIPAGIIFIAYLAIGVGFFISEGFRARMGAAAAMMGGGDDINYYAVTLNQGLNWSLLFVFVATIIVGANVIAADNRANALLVYLAKPLTRLDYLVGKWVGVFILLASLTVIPSLVMFLFFIAAYYNDGFLTDNKTLFWRMLAAALLLPAIHTSLIIGFSSWTKSPRLAGSLYAAFYFVMVVLSATFGAILIGHDKDKTNPATAALVTRLSIDGVVRGVAIHLYDLTPQQADQGMGGRRRNRKVRKDKNGNEIVPPPLSAIATERPPLAPLLGLAGAMIGLPLWAAWTKIKAVEIIKG